MPTAFGHPTAEQSSRSRKVRVATLSSLALLAGVLAIVGATAIPRRLTRAAAAAADSTRARSVRVLLRQDMDRLDIALAAIETAPTTEAARRAAGVARAPLREVEGMLARYGPGLLVDLNSDESNPPDEDGADGYKVRRGFQLLDSVFADAHAPAGAWKDEVRRMRLQASRFRATIELVTPSEREVIDLARYELARVSTLTIAGFDANADDALPDAAASLAGVSELLEQSHVGDSVVLKRLSAARAFLNGRSFAAFDRYTFIRGYVNPVFVALAARRRLIPGPEPPVRSTWPGVAGTIYDARALDVMSYAPPNAPALTRDWIALGRDLFFDARLSESADRSCATCHLPELAFRDGLPRATPRTIAGNRDATLRHTPTLINAAMQPSLFTDGRRSTLEQQIAEVLSNPREMGGDLPRVVARIGGDATYRARFASARSGSTPSTAESGKVDSLAIVSAIASYLRTLQRFDAPFDRAMRGEAELDDASRRGFNLFMGRAGCGTCHFAPLFSGTQPPAFTHSDPEVIGVPGDGRDLGRGAIDRRGGLARSFKTPTVRNAAVGNGPFMHNGGLHTLAEVIAFYDAGGAATPGARPRNVTLPSDSLHLSAAERSDLLAFIGSLTDTTGTTRRP